MRHPDVVIAVLTLVLTIACQTERDPKNDVAAPAQQDTPFVAPTARLERPMALRREGQGLLDSARMTLTRGESGVAATLLEQAASFFVKQAHTPPNGGTDDLLAAARGLDSLANDVRQRRLVNSSRLDRLSAHANLAEAERHGALATVAWSTRSKESVSDELTMAADHVQRAARDGSIALAPEMRRLLADLRVLVRDLSARRELDMRDLDEPLASLHIEIQAMHRRLEHAPNKV